MLLIFVIISLIVGTIAVAVAAVDAASPMPVISVDPSVITAEVGETFTVDITVAGITEEESLYGWEVCVSFNDPKKDTWTGDNVTKSFVTTEKPIFYESDASAARAEKIYVNQTFMPRVTEGTDTWTGDGANKMFYTTRKPVDPFSEKVYVNGTKVRGDGVHYYIDYTTGNINFTYVPGVGAEIKATYGYAQYIIGYTTGNITFRTAPGLGAEIEAIYWIPPILEVVGVMEGPFLSDISPSTSWDVMPPDWDNRRGNVSVNNAFWLSYPAEGATGSGVLCNITFQVKAVGKTTLDFYGTALRTYDETLPLAERHPPIEHMVEDGIFAYPLSRDIAVTSVTASPASVPPGETVSINVTVENQGNVPEAFNVTTYYDSAVIDTIVNVILEDGVDTHLTFTWDTTGVATGTYTIKAEASPLPDEDDPADNVCYADQEVAIELAHDIALIEVTPSSTSVSAGKLVSINVTVKNEGSATETFDVTVLYDSTAIDTKTVTDLAPGDSETLSFSWNTKDVAEGDYTITAVASGIDEETDTADNTYTNVVVTVTAPLPGFPTPLFVAIIIAVATMFSVVFLYTRRRRSTKA